MLPHLPHLFQLGLVLPPVHLNRYFILALVAFGAGAINAVAGGGSFFSFPALLGVRLPPVNANATNTVALWPGQLATLVALRRELNEVRWLLVPAMVAAAVGGTAGALTLLSTSQTTFMRLVPWLLLFATVLFAASDVARSWLDRLRASRKQECPAEERTVPWALLLGLLVVSFYVGYFGAGAGFLLLSVISLFGTISNLHEMNALKNLCNSIANGIAAFLFVLARAIYWREGLLMLVLAIAGGYFGGAYSRKLNPRIARAVVIVTGLTLSMFYFHKSWH